MAAANTAMHAGWRALAGPIAWWDEIDSSPAKSPASDAAFDGVQAELREVFTRAGLDVTDPVVLQSALLATSFLRVTARRDARLERISTDEAAAVMDATTPVGVALTRWVPEEVRR